uniref:PHB domain-containing protein n=1 Tax=Mesocestoides corti TaxID=53468 RepID=A0A5K3EYF1_MESCO
AAVLRQLTAEKIAARSFVKAYLEPILPNTFELLTARGYFYDNVQQELEESFVTSLMEKTVNLNTLELRARLTIDGIIREAVLQRHVEYRELGRELMTEELITRVIPGLRTTLAHMVIKQLIGLAIERLEQIAAARKRVLAEVVGEILEDAITTTAEREAKRLEELEALEAEMTEEQFD